MSDVCKKCGFDYEKWQGLINSDNVPDQYALSCVLEYRSDLKKLGYDTEKPLHIGGFCQKCVPQVIQRKQKLAQIIALMTELLEESE